jgi:hypothetical protein
MATRHELETSSVDRPDRGELGPIVADESQAPQSKASTWVAWLMDEVIPIPGTKVKIGLDPVLSVLAPLGLPVGDALTSGISLLTLVEAVRRGLPFWDMMRIAWNILANAGCNAIPVLGTVFSVFFRSNSRNRDIVNEYLRKAIETGKPGSWLRVIPVLLFLGVFLVGTLILNMLLWAFVLTKLFEPLGWKLPWSTLGQ